MDPVAHCVIGIAQSALDLPSLAYILSTGIRFRPITVRRLSSSPAPSHRPVVSRVATPLTRQVPFQPEQDPPSPQSDTTSPFTATSTTIWIDTQGSEPNLQDPIKARQVITLMQQAYAIQVKHKSAKHKVQTQKNITKPSIQALDKAHEELQSPAEVSPTEQPRAQLVQSMKGVPNDSTAQRLHIPKTYKNWCKAAGDHSENLASGGKMARFNQGPLRNNLTQGQSFSYQARQPPAHQPQQAAFDSEPMNMDVVSTELAPLKNRKGRSIPQRVGAPGPSYHRHRPPQR